MTPRTSLRLRLTLYHAGVFLISSTLLVGVTYFLVRHNVGPVRALLGDPSSTAAIIPQRRLDHDAWQRTLAQLALCFAVLTALSVVAGWYLAGRALQPLRQITDVARRVADANLDERIALRGHPDELKRLADGIDGMLDRIDSIVAAQRRFISDASHELRTPLAVMRAGIDVTLNDPDATDDERRATTSTLAESIDRSEALIRSMLALARAEQAAEERVEVDLAEIVAQSLADVTEQIEERGLELTTRLEPTTVHGDPPLLRTMAGNLLRNAVAYNRPRGAIEVIVEARGGLAALMVGNTGDVVLEDEVRTLFEPFRRSRASRSTGAGLGLSIVESVVQSHGGRVSAHARPTGGLDVTILLPRAVGHDEQDTTNGPKAETKAHKRLFFAAAILVLCASAAAAGFAAFSGAVALAHVPIAQRSDGQAARGLQAFPLVWTGMSEANVRRVAGTPSWAAPNGVCAFRIAKGIGLAPCWPGQRCLEYGDVDSARSVEFCFQGGLTSKRIWQRDAWDALVAQKA